MLKRRSFYLTISLFCLNGCQDPELGEPACRVAPETAQPEIADAVCVVRLDDKLLTVTHRLSGKFDLPGGTSNQSETAQCTAHRETWEETGFNVEVGMLLHVNPDGLRYYACQLSGNFDGQLTEFPVPDWARVEVSSIQLIDPFKISNHQWRFNNRLNNLRGMFNKVKNSDPAEPQKPDLD